MRLPGSLLACAVAAALAGCGGDENDQPASAPETTTVTESAPSTQETTSETTTEQPPPATETQPPGEGTGCTSDAGQIEVTGGKVDCEIAIGVAAGYDPQGAKVQEVGDWTCQGGNATTGLLFTCVLGDNEFVVRKG